MQFLQANGRITKTPANSNLGAKTKVSESKNDTVAKHSHNSFSEKTTPRVAAVGAEAVVAAGNADLCQTDLQVGKIKIVFSVNLHHKLCAFFSWCVVITECIMYVLFSANIVIAFKNKLLRRNFYLEKEVC